MDNNDFNLPKQFEEFEESRRNGFIKAQKLKEAGGRLAGIFCSYTPTEIIDAAKCIPVSLCGMSEETIEAAEVDLPKNLCPLIKSSYGFAVSDKCPYTYFSDIIIGETTCDGKKKMYELLGNLKDTYILHLPQGQNKKYSLEMWKKEIVLLKNKLEEKFNIKITVDDIKEAIKLRNKEREVKIRAYELNKSIPPKTYYKNIHKMIDSLNFSFDLKNDLLNIEKTIDQIENDYKNSKNIIDKNKKRIMITGCPISGVFDKTISILENNNAIVCVVDSCNGIKSALNFVDENNKDVYEAIAKRYLDIDCAVMTPNENRLNKTKYLINEFNVDGVVEVILQSCHPFDIEKKKISDLCKNIHIPYISIETDYSKLDIAQITTRLQAFLEML